jgi:hypothetical protein
MTLNQHFSRYIIYIDDVQFVDEENEHQSLNLNTLKLKAPHEMSSWLIERRRNAIKNISITKFPHKLHFFIVSIFGNYWKIILKRKLFHRKIGDKLDWKLNFLRAVSATKSTHSIHRSYKNSI